MSMYIVEYGPNISDRAKTIIIKDADQESWNNETSIYNIDYCIEALQYYPEVSADIDYLIELSYHDTNPRTYIEF